MANNNVMLAYVHTAQDIIRENIKLADEEAKLAERRKKLDKREKDFITELEDMGLQSLSLTDGTTLSVVEKYHCNINSNLADKDNVAFWLRENGAEDLVSSVVEIGDSEDAKDLLRAEGIAFVEKVDMNTNKVKAFIKEGLGITGQVQQFDFQDLPKGLHFFVSKEIEVE